MLKTLRTEFGAIGWLLRTLTLAAIGGAIIQELRLPPEERTWHGKLLGAVPYDFRLPTPKRLIDAYWNPSSKRLFNDQPFGVGWAVNIPVAIGVIGGVLNSGSPASRKRSAARSNATASKATAD